MKLELRRVSVPTPGTQDARRSWPERESLLVRVTDREGEMGLGEASPLPGYSKDTLADVEQALRAVSAHALEAALQQAPARSALRAAAGLVGPELPSARMALETAALDLLGRKQGVSAPVLLGGQPKAQRPLAVLLGPVLDPTLDQRIAAAMSVGFRHLKLKLGAPGGLQRELAVIVALRQRLGVSVQLRLDANGALSSSEVTAAWAALEHAGIELFEEPGAIPESLVGRLPLALDESLQDLSDDEVDAEMRRQKPRCLVLKPMALGGIDHCWRLAERAREHGVVVVVSHCFDGPLAFRSAAALALALPRGPAQGLGPHPALGAWKIPHVAPQGALLEAWPEPGLGDLGSLW